MANTPAKSQQMAQIDMKTEFPKLSETDQHYIKKWENVNATRAKRAISMRSNNRYTGWIIAGFALSIYLYTIRSIRQETFLDDFDEVPDQSKKAVS